MLTNNEWLTLRQLCSAEIQRFQQLSPALVETLTKLRDKVAKIEAMSIGGRAWSDTHTTLLRQDIQTQVSHREHYDRLSKLDEEGLDASDYRLKAAQLLRMWFAVAAMRSK